MSRDSDTVAALATRFGERLLQEGDGTLNTARRIRRGISRELKTQPGKLVVDLALHAVGQGSLPRWFVYEVVRDHPSAVGCLGPRSVVRLAGSLSSWGDVDAFACILSGQAWRAGVIADTQILRWAQQREPLWRRAALVSTVPLNNKTQGGRGDAPRTLAVCDALVSDRDDLVVKAMSWALRELSAPEARAVAEYVERRQAELAPRVLREVRNKLSTGLKSPRRR